MKNFVFDLQRFAVTKTLSSIAKAITAVGEEIVTDGKKIQFIGSVYDLANITADLYDSIKSIHSDIKNRNYNADSFLESLKVLSNSLDGLASVLEKLPRVESLPVFGLAASMPSFTQAIRNAKNEKNTSSDHSISQESIDEIVESFIDVVGETVKTLLVLVPIPAVAGADTIVDLTIFPILIDILKADFKAMYLTSVHDNLDPGDTFMEKWLGGINDLISDVVASFRGKVSSAEYSNGLIKIVDADGNVRYYNETNNARINLPNKSNILFNYAYGSTISGGSQNDTIYSKPNSDDNSNPQGNSILVGSGKDFIVAYDDNSTIDGGTDDDRIAIFGKNNKICGGDGTDAILLESGANDNTIDSGRGNDYIILEDGVKNAIILYTEGDGNDIIVGYEESDELRILADYSASVNGQDVIIGVGNDSITLSGAAGKEININGTKQVIGSKPTNPPLIITLPSVWYPGVNEIRGTAGDDTIKNARGNVRINSGASNDYIKNGGYWDYSWHNGVSNVTIGAGDGNDSIDNYGSSVTIDVSAGDDSICNNGSEVTIHDTIGNDYIENRAPNVMIRTGIGNNYISNWDYASNVTIDSGDGKNTVSNSKNNVLIKTGLDNDYVGNGGDFVTINVDDGNDEISNTGSNVIINGGSGNDSISNSELIIKDSYYLPDIHAPAEKVIITGGDGNDSIKNRGGNNVSINAGTGDDSVYNHGGNGVIIDGGAGNDFIDNYYSHSVSIDSGAGNDNIQNNGDKVTINGSSGNDFISLNSYALYNLIEYRTGDGNDTIWGFNTTSTLKIIGASYSSVKSGDDIIFTVGNGKIMLKNVANLASANIVTVPPEPKNIIGTESSETITNYANNSTITGGRGNDTITDTGSNVLFNYTPGDGNDLIYGFDSTDTFHITDMGLGLYMRSTIGNNIVVYVDDEAVTLVGANDKNINITGGIEYTLTTIPLVTMSVYNAQNDTMIYGTNHSDTLKNSGNVVIINADAGNDSVHNEGNLVTITGGKGNDHISLSSGSENTLIDYASGDGNDTVWGFNEDDTLKISDDAYSTMTSGNNVVVKVGSGSVTLKDVKGKTLNIDGEELEYEPIWTLKGTTATCEAADKTKITVKGVKSTEGLSLVGDTIIVSAASLGTQKVTVGNGYTLILGDDVKESTLDDAEWTLKNTTATLSQKQSAGYVCDGNSITYSSKAKTTTLATLTGVQSIDGLSVDGNIITLSEDALGSTNIKITKGDYKLALDDDVATEPTTAPTWFISGTKATYKDGNSAYYSLATNGKSISFVKAAADKKAKDLIIINGINKNLTADDVEIDEDNQIVTLSNNALNKKTVTIGGSENYSLALGDDVKEAEVDEPQWSLKKTTATLSQKQSAGYVCNGYSITYSSKAATVTLATLTGVQSIDGLSVDGNIITLSEDALGSTNIKITKGDYKLALDDDVATEPTTAPTWFISGTKATYKDGNSAYYSLASNNKSINFVKEAADKKAKDLISLNGINKNFSPDDIDINETDKIVTLSNNALDKKNVTIGGSENYSLALADDVPEVTLGKPKLDVKGSKASLTQSTSVGYVLTNDKTITFSKKVSATTRATVTGVKSKSGISFDEASVTLSNSALNNKVTVSGDVSFEFKANYKNASITGSKDDDVISVLGTGVSVTGGKGDDYFTSGGINTFIYASGDGDDVIADFTSSDKIKVTSGDFTVNTDGNDVIVSVTKGKVTGSITLSDAAGQSITILDNKNKGHLYFTSPSDYWFDENSFDTTSDISSIANISDTNNPVGALNNFNEMNHQLNSFDYLSNEENYFATYCDKK